MGIEDGTFPTKGMKRRLRVGLLRDGIDPRASGQSERVTRPAGKEYVGDEPWRVAGGSFPLPPSQNRT
jgi:hypothetical protein